MIDSEIRAAILRVLRRTAPEADLDALTPDADLRDALDIDSFDSLNVLIALHEALGVGVPESDYGQVRTLNGMVRYFAERIGPAAPERTGS